MTDKSDLTTPLLAKEGLTTVLESCVQGALRDTINAHGPITLTYLNSATKRVAGEIRGYLTNLTNQTLIQHVDAALLRELEDMRERNTTLHKTVRDLVAKCKASGVLTDEYADEDLPYSEERKHLLARLDEINIAHKRLRSMAGSTPVKDS